MASTLARRAFLAALATATVSTGRMAWADNNPTLDLRQTLEKGLKARRPVEFRFVARVIELVEAGVLPKKTVQSTFLWARKKPDHPFQYFQRALTIRAGLIGVQL